MKKFQDRQGREWEVNLTYQTVKNCRAAGIDILDVNNPSHKENALARVHDDPIFLADVMWELCGEQVQREKLERETFGEAMILSANAAREAMLLELADFFRKAQMENEEAMVRKSAEARPAFLEMQKTRIAGIDVSKLLS